jgi:tRNA(Ile)-lysidine synthase
MTDSLVSQVRAALEAGGLRKTRIAVGLSGGVDSIVLLHLLRRGLRLPPARISAIHVNHQISAHAAAWATHCRRYCRDLGVKLEVAKVEVPRGNSTEAAARAARHRVFAACNADVVALAHNRDDQAETLLLQLLRGAGPRGLSAMPVFKPGIPALWRPLLEVPRSAIEAYGRHHRLSWVEDDSNIDRAYLRNFLRHDVLPLIERRVPGAGIVLARAARLQAEASDLLDVLADQDIGAGAVGTSLALAQLQDMPAHRARNALRRFLRRHGALMPEAGRLDELLRQALTARADARVCVDLGDVELRRFRGALHVVAPLPPLPRNFEKAWNGRAPLVLPQLGGTLRLEQRKGSGIAVEWLQRGRLTVRVRRGGEVLRLASGGPRRTVRNLLQESALPPWLRERLPLLYLGEELAAVPGIGVDARFRCVRDGKGLIPVWSPAPF